MFGPALGGILAGLFYNLHEKAFKEEGKGKLDEEAAIN